MNGEDFSKEKLEAFFSTRKLISVRGIEREAGVADNTLHYAIKGTRVLNKKQIDLLKPVLQKYGFGFL